MDRIALETAIENDVSTYPPKAGWSVGFALGRNVYLYGLAEEIYVAESDNKGGTWNGAMDGLGKGRKIFVRRAAPEEKCANNELIAKGAIAVDGFGNMVKSLRNYNEGSGQKTLFEI